ncbi:MAG: phosphatidate cytidylyltransferase [Lutibacter sp.]|jgi:phosphatidate cytidylyltransferase|nr:phosphatidate cytidylyltransferase [Lutibacter sp.]
MGKLLTRMVSGVLFGMILTFAILYSKETFMVLFYLIMLVCMFEFNRMIGVNSIFPYLIGTLLFLLIINLAIEEFHSKIIFEYTGLVLFLSIFFSFLSVLFEQKNTAALHLGKIFLSIFYIVIPFSLMVRIPFLNASFAYVNTTILGVFILIWTNDSFAFFVGKNLGKHKLLERVSPNKTIEGFIGGMVFTFIAGFILATQFNTYPLIQWLVIAGIVSVFGVLGDLIESVFKRQAGIKDSSNYIPGHGGFLDRFDSVIFAAPFIFIYLQFIQ